MFDGMSWKETVENSDRDEVGDVGIDAKHKALKKSR